MKKELLQNLKADISKNLDIKNDSLSISIYENSSGVVYTLEEFFNQYNPEEIDKGQCHLLFRVIFDGRTISSFTLRDMYDCCGIIVGSDLYVDKQYRNKGLGKIFTKFMSDFSRYYGYGIIQACDKISNEYQNKIFTRLGWVSIINFNNPKTKNELSIWLLNLN